MYKAVSLICAAGLSACTLYKGPPSMSPNQILNRVERDAAVAAYNKRPDCWQAMKDRGPWSGMDLVEAQCAKDSRGWDDVRRAINDSFATEVAQIPDCAKAWAPHVPDAWYSPLGLNPHAPDSLAYLLLNHVLVPGAVASSDETLACMQKVCTWRRDWAPNVWTEIGAACAAPIEPVVRSAGATRP